tara:strand:- start:2014 stop:2196 length:183 start_codon:yes stop_codon:yes gene_type:complete
MSYQYDERDWAPLSNFQNIECEECGREFEALGVFTPASHDSPADFETDDTLCPECECKEK